MAAAPRANKKEKNPEKMLGKAKPADKLRPNKAQFKKPKDPLKNRKEDQADDPALPPQISSAILAAEDSAPDFPRGGASLLSRSEKAEARAEADEEFKRDAKKKRRLVKSRLDGEDEWASLFGVGVTGKLPRFANRITMKNISPNMKLWGVVAEVNPKDLVISLPGGLRGFVHAEDASDLFPDKKPKDLENNLLCNTFYVGQLVPCIVIQVTEDKKEGKGSKRVLLSLHLSLLNKGLSLDSLQDGMVLNAYVKSVEDHGYILHFGSTSFSGFLSKGSQDVCEIKLKHGQLVQGVVKSIDKGRGVVYLSSDTDMLSKSLVRDLKGLSIDALVPGMMVNARVHATLENGIMLSFLTYFTGTVDIFHLQNLFPSTSWKDDYYQNKKVNARILFIDPTTRAVGLTLNPYLIRNNVPPSYVKTGDIFDNSRIVRVDRGIGLLLEIPSIPEVSPAYISRLDVADSEVKKLEKKFKEGNCVRVRIVGVRHLEGLAMGTLKAIAFEGSIFTHSDVKPGMLAKAKVVAVESFGAIVQFSSGVKALCPLPHMSEFEITKPAKKFKVGAELLFRVLGCKSKRITVTYKKTLVKSKLDVLASYTDAIEGLITHGWISKIDRHGCFLKFYNGVHAFVHRSELGLEPGSEPTDVYHVGQVIKCRIISSVPASRRINASFVLSSKRATETEGPKLGSLVSAVATRLTPNAVIVELTTSSPQRGIIYDEHLADYNGHASLLKSLVKPGYKFDQLLVLDIDGRSLVLSAKHSLVSSQDLPSDITQMRPHSIVHGYICNLTGTGCFVRFLGRLTGLSPLNKICDEHVDDLSDAFYVGQSVRSHVVNVNNDASRVILSLKQSSCFSTDASFIEGYFLSEEKIAGLQASNSSVSRLGVQSFHIGQVVEGVIQEKKDYGVVVSFDGHNDVVGFVTHYQLGGSDVKVGSSVRALVLDISAVDSIVDLSLKPELLERVELQGAKSLSKKKRQRDDCSMQIDLHNPVNAVVEMVKERYLVVSIPKCSSAIGFASLIDYNTQKLPCKKFTEGQSVLATVEALPASSPCGRLLLLLKSQTGVLDASSAKRAKKRSAYVIGSLVQAEITDKHPIEVFLKFGVGCRGRVHITEVMDDFSLENPLANYKIGQLVTARIVAKGGKGYQWEMSLKPSILADSEETRASVSSDEFSFSIGQSVGGYVVKVDQDWVSLTISRSVNAQIYILDSSCEPDVLQEFQTHYSIGKAVSGHVICIHRNKKLLRLLSRPSIVALGESSGEANLVNASTEENNTADASFSKHILQGDVIGGRIKKILPGVGGLVVQIGPHLYGKAHYTELTYEWTSHPLSGYHEGQYVRCNVLEISRSAEGFVHVDLSLRTISEKTQPTISSEDLRNMTSFCKRFEKVQELQAGMDVKGYVKNISSKGCFVMLSRKIDARVLLSNMSDSYIESPEEDFPIGKLVHGRVISAEALSGRVDVTLKSSTGSRVSKSELSDYSSLHVGDVISGKIKRIESFGLFVAIDHTNMVGLCHISEISDDRIENIESKYKAGDKVKVKILKVDLERRRISLGMKNSYAIDDISIPVPTDNDAIDTIDKNVSSDDELQSDPNLDLIRNVYGRLADTKSCASVLPLDVKLDDMSDSNLENDAPLKEENAIVASIATENMKKRLKKKEKEVRELEISASEERRLQNDVPRTVDDFEKLVRSSPNSSYVWIQYMAHLLSLAEVEKARSVAERALRTINFREENEKLNVWVAYFNLENEYGIPREEAVRKIFERALQFCDPKKLHFALLRIYDRTEQYKLADELLEKMTKKFRNSCKVWLHSAQSLLKQSKDGIQNVVNRALLSLPRKKHIKFISQTAILEFKCGMPDRGRSLFEGILREYPKRTDLWSIYIDQEIRLGDAEITRALFERATCLGLPAKKLKFLLKKYLEYEKSHGDEERVEYVKKKALEYVESSKS